jgi:phosphohistidine phosphatase
MRLWLLRHAKSSWDQPDLADHDRPLAPRGERDAERMAAFIEGTYIRPALVLSSSGLRARQTLGRVLPSLGETLELRVEPALYSFDPSVLLSRLRSVLDDVPSVLLVGHNPALQELALTLAEDGDALATVAKKFPTCGLAEIELHLGSWRDVAPATGTLMRVTVPTDLA